MRLIKRNAGNDGKWPLSRETRCGNQSKTRRTSRFSKLSSRVKRVKRKISASRGREREREGDETFISIAARFECATSRTARCALGTFPLFLPWRAENGRVFTRQRRARTRDRDEQREEWGTREGQLQEDREAAVEEDGSKPDTRFVRRVYPVSRK